MWSISLDGYQMKNYVKNAVSSCCFQSKLGSQYWLSLRLLSGNKSILLKFSSLEEINYSLVL